MYTILHPWSLTSQTVSKISISMNMGFKYILITVDALDEPVGDADSGMSTSHSPEDNFKQFSRQDQGN